MTTQYKIEIYKNVNIYGRGSDGAASIGKVVLTDIHVANNKNGSYYFVPTLKGWVKEESGKVNVLDTVAKNGNVKAAQKIEQRPINQAQNIYNQLKSGQSGLGDLVRSSLQRTLMSQTSSAVKFDASMRLYGQPFQFTDITDPRIPGLDLGRKYVETYISEAPIVYFMPGKASYLPEVNQEEKNIFEEIITQASAVSSKVVQDILNTDQRFFDFVPDYTNYMNYVNGMCRVGAALMGIGDRDAPVIKGYVKKYRFFDWANYKYEDAYTPKDSGKDEVFTLGGIVDKAAKSVTESIETWYGGFQYVQFYADPSSSFQESGSNNSGTSAVQSLLEKAQGAVKELSFMGSAASSMTGIPDAINGTKEIVSSGLDAFSAGIFSKVFSNTNVIVDGGNMMFPEIWGDSNYNKSYNISINLVSPYGDKESIYLHVLVPLFHLIALTLPRQITANGYGQPFFVKVSSKGWFNCDLGMVDSISIEKVMGSFSANGLPTELRVDLSVKDLYPNIMTSSSTTPGLFFENKALMNWLAVTCGLDVTKPAIEEKWKNVLVTLIAGSVLDIPGNLSQSTLETLRNAFSGILDITRR